MSSESVNKVEGPTVALFPGAFRPPHVNHFAVVAHLASREDIDEVVIVVTNRSRAVPGTTTVLGPELAVNVWQMYLRGTPNESKVRVEVASTSAVSHAVEYVNSCQPGSTVLLVLGRQDIEDGRKRFGKLRSRNPRTDVSASVIGGPPGTMNVRATALRTMIGDRAEGEPAPDSFGSALPPHLGRAERTEVWALCRSSMVEESLLATRSIAAVLDDRGVALDGAVELALPPKVDQVYKASLADGRTVFVKYANNTVASDRVGGSQRKPRRRLKAEREAIKWLHANVNSPVQVPEVLCFDRATRTLVLTEVCGGGRPLSEDLDRGIFDASVGAAVTGFLATAHTAAMPGEPFWDEPERELGHWRAMLELRTTASAWPGRSANVEIRLRELREASDAARTNGFRHLDFTPNNVLRRGQSVAVIDFELSATVGDTAYDLGTMMGYYLEAGLRRGSPLPAVAATQQMLAAYRAAVGPAWSGQAGRVVGFAGATLLQLADRNSGPAAPTVAAIAQAGTNMLSVDLETGSTDALAIVAAALSEPG